MTSAVPAGIVDGVRDNVAQAVNVARSAPGARPFAGQIVAAANDSFIGGLHLVGFVAAGVTLVAALGVLRYLPARPREVIDPASVPRDESAPATAPAEA